MGRFRAAACWFVVVACGGASQSNVRALGGILNASPATLDFGDIALGKEQTHPVVLRNTGLVSMTVAHLDQFADPAFEVKGLPATLGPGGSVEVSVRYRPPQLGSHERMLRIVTDSPASQGADVDLRGNAVRGLVALSGDSFDFGPSDIHRMTHAGGGPAISIHAYSPPLRGMGAYVIEPDGVLRRAPIPYTQELRAPVQAAA